MAQLSLLSCSELPGVGPVLVYLWVTYILHGELVEGRWKEISQVW